ncbi:R3H domain-containing protein 4-like [Patiria miniata]|uniref:R3H-associated N-terminal domain-containing protein n=1 Tax=Patiria miniata TaxID=46514 RepID=A0A914AXF2_PATMI|nr:R3H domain-containing protein 4-like [Patiria miniata]
MGITKEEEDNVLPEQSELIVPESVETKPPVSPRRQRQRRSRHCCPTVSPKSAGHKTGGHKRTRRYENTCFLLSLVDEADFGEVSISDFVESSQSVFEQLLSDRDSLEIWNDFMNRPEDEQEIFLQQVATKEVPKKETGKQEKEAGTAVDKKDNKDDDKRTVHPAHTPEESFQRINSRLRTMLRRKHLPKGMLQNHEDDLVPWFTDDPGAVFISHINCSFDRLLMHAVCQYLDLQSISYDCDGRRQTKVENGQDYFSPPKLLLSQYLDSLHS